MRELSQLTNDLIPRQKGVKARPLSLLRTDHAKLHPQQMRWTTLAGLVYSEIKHLKSKYARTRATDA